MVLDISSFEELKEHLPNVVNYEEVLWIVDESISSKESILELIENKNIITISSIKGAGGKQLNGGKGDGIILAITNKCLEKN